MHAAVHIPVLTAVHTAVPASSAWVMHNHPPLLVLARMPVARQLFMAFVAARLLTVASSNLPLLLWDAERPPAMCVHPIGKCNLIDVIARVIGG